MSHGEGIPAPARSGNDSSRLFGRTELGELGVPHVPPPHYIPHGHPGKTQGAGRAPRGHAATAGATEVAVTAAPGRGPQPESPDVTSASPSRER